MGGMTEVFRGMPTRKAVESDLLPGKSQNIEARSPPPGVFTYLSAYVEQEKSSPTEIRRQSKSFAKLRIALDVNLDHPKKLRPDTMRLRPGAINSGHAVCRAPISSTRTCRIHITI